MKFNYKNILVTAGCVASVMVAANATAAKTYPARTITDTVTWSAGGGTDSINRMLMAEMSKTLDVNIKVTNKTGGVAGSIGMSSVLAKRADGYNIVGIADSNVTAAVNGGWDKKFDVWYPYIVGGSPDLVSVSADSPYKTLEELIAAAKKEPGEIKAGAGGSGSIHHINLLGLEKGTDISFKFVPYPGSAPSQTAAATGEISVVITSAAEQSALLRAGKLRPLAMLTKDSFTISGVGEIPSAFDAYPQLKDFPLVVQSIGFAVHASASDEVKNTLAEAFKKAMASQEVKTWADKNLYTLSGAYGEEATEIFSQLESTFAWTLWELGAAKFNPEKFGIPKP
ncbi:tripartite tricarboxylate transporter substrate binding protein [Vibrio sp. CK2-1]|uniref:Bug family tripartite tricarboxylate transporter substrate binding protein n=1 Tax=Vibrio sp. CK2-1 TaxID=2912249 RepID=UPI001F1DD454|nr:tripartite tricarboxylate transporter substrate binding protein [Vibrio sp. CK2-1]MCF7353168.1 tripartite tricarboxylate transporter substrate binding protein [Vibrio sp. CK2-1]